MLAANGVANGELQIPDQVRDDNAKMTPHRYVR